VTWDVALLALAHDVPDGTRRATATGHRRNVAIGRHATRRNAPDNHENTIGETGHLMIG